MKHVTTTNIIFVLWGIVLLCLTELYYEYVRYYLYVSIIVIIPFTIWNLIRQKKEDRAEGTNEFKFSIYRMMIVAVVLGFMFFITRQNHI